MCKVIAIANQKGGAAKTTTINLGACMGEVRGKRVRAHPQGHLTMGLGFLENLKKVKNMMENIIMGLEFDPKRSNLTMKKVLT